MTEYKRTLEDKLDWSLLDQLHNVVIQTGTFCFRTKRSGSGLAMPHLFF